MSESSLTSLQFHDDKPARTPRATGKMNVSDLELAEVVSIAEQSQGTSELSLERRGGDSFLISRA